VRESGTDTIIEMAPTFELTTPPKAQPGDKVAVLSPSWAGPGVFPEVHEIGLRVLREDLGLEVVEFPTTRKIGASAQERANDLMAAFSDPSIRAVMASIGGSDQITVLPHLDANVFIDNPKSFFGYSDNTNFLNWLWRLGITSYHGGSTLVHLARPGGVHPVFIDSLRRALFTSETAAIEPVERFTDLQCEWEDRATLENPLPTTPEPGWSWHNATKMVTGPTWGGNLEILHWNLATNRWILANDEYKGCVLILETSEEMPTSEEVFRMLRDAGERGLLAQFPAVVVAKPKAWHTHAMLDDEEQMTFRGNQQDAVLRALSIYNPEAMVVFGPDFGHTDPQYVLPYGGQMTIDGPARRITASY
jgi:muramoyltetrapeptide carboxypeptidase LdcA involved in peptidoglycan recycling